MVRHPPDCAACAANRAALLRNAPPPRVCELSRREQHLRSPRPPLRQIACPQQTRYAPPSRVPAPSATPSKPKTLAARSATSASAAIAPYQAGLKAFTSLVADKLVRFRSIQHTALADMLVAEALDGCQDKPCYDSMTIDKNIRRRTYDTLNVFASMGIVVRSGKNVMWKGHQAILQQMQPCRCKRERPSHPTDQPRQTHLPPRTHHLQTCHVALLTHLKRNVQTRRSCIETKRRFLQALQRRQQSLCALLARNVQNDSSRVRAGRYSMCSDLSFRVPCHANCIEMPFIIVVCKASSSSSDSCLVELSDDRLSVGLSFDTPFRVLHDYTLVDLVMNCSLNKSAHARPHTQQNQNLNPASSAP
eukprot:gb/GEZJ01003146.1/.p1 GENE.gb/GEZJ01003146.1/~~gb/GEZJ01003146.1/.p1  ORF type:complete len:362 (+),score=37.10 gb/GEZJ01003146.1/:377-1462(+)